MADISRRSLFGAIAAFAFAPLALAHTPGGKSGLLTAQDAIARGICSRVQVFLNGRDVTKLYRIRTVNFAEGWIEYYVRDEHGAYQPDGNGGLIMARTHGDVMVRIHPIGRIGRG